MAAAQKAAVTEQGLRSEIATLQEALQRTHAARYPSVVSCIAMSVSECELHCHADYPRGVAWDCFCTRSLFTVQEPCSWVHT